MIERDELDRIKSLIPFFYDLIDRFEEERVDKDIIRRLQEIYELCRKKAGE